MRATELIKELQGLVEAYGDSELMVGKEKLKADMGIGGIDNALVIWLHAGPFAQLAIRGLPQPQEPVGQTLKRVMPSDLADALQELDKDQ